MITLYSILHGPEIWLAIAIWGFGAACGVAVSWAAVEISDRREERRHESAAPALDHPAELTVGMMTTALMVAAHNADEWKDKEDEEDNEHKNDL